MINKDPTPSTPKPTTPIPITDPPENAISNALPSESWAAFVVLTFALVATLIPMNPASPEHKAPTTKDTATNQLLPSLIPLNANRTAVIITKIDKILYSAFKNAIAPSAIFLAIFSIFALPTSFLETHEFLRNTKIKAIIPAAGIRFI